MRLPRIFFLIISAPLLLACSNTISSGSYYPSKVRAAAVKAIESAEQAKEEADRATANREEIERQTQNIKGKITVTEAQSEQVENESASITRQGSYSRVR